MLQYASAQPVTQDQNSGLLIKEIEKVTKDLGYNISPNNVPTSNSLPLEFGTRPGGTMQPVVPGASGNIAVLVWENEGKAQAFSKERFDLSTKGDSPVLDQRKDGVVWYFVGGGGTYYGPLKDNKIEYSGGAIGEFVCGKVTFSADETIISDSVDYPAGGIDQILFAVEGRIKILILIAKADKISKKASDDLGQRLASWGSLAGFVAAAGMVLTEYYKFDIGAKKFKLFGPASKT